MTRAGLARKTKVHLHGVKLEGRLRSSIDDELSGVLGAFGGRIGEVHVRLYPKARETGLFTCHIRVDVLPSGGVALGERAADLETAVARTAAELGPAVRRGLEQGHWPGSRHTTAGAVDRRGGLHE